jgi:hypothetical protein
MGETSGRVALRRYEEFLLLQIETLGCSDIRRRLRKRPNWSCLLDFAHDWVSSEGTTSDVTTARVRKPDFVDTIDYVCLPVLIAWMVWI